MSTETNSEGPGRLDHTGLAAVLLALLIGITIAAYGLGPSMFPSDLFLGTLVFTVVMIGVGVITQQTGDRDNGY